MEPITILAFVCASALGLGIFGSSTKGEITIEPHQLIIRRMVIRDGEDKAGICGVKIKIKSKRKAPLKCRVKITYYNISKPFYFALEEKPSGNEIETIPYDKDTFMIHTLDPVLCFDTYADLLPAKIELVNVEDDEDKTTKDLTHEWAKQDRNGWFGARQDVHLL